jgi:hypothetical protein
MALVHLLVAVVLVALIRLVLVTLAYTAHVMLRTQPSLGNAPSY